MSKRRNFSVEETHDICETYLKTHNRKPIREKYNCTDKVIVRVLLENQIEILHKKTKPVGSGRVYKINDSYFNLNNQSHNSAYILGILASDGCVSSAQNQIYIELQREDKEILEKINSELKNERPIKDYFNQSKEYNNSKLYFFSKQIKEDLALYNIVPNKTKECQNKSFMENIQEQYQIDYIRGHFDGDGCIKWTGGSLQWQIDSTSLSTLKDIQKALLKIGIETKIVKHFEEAKGRNRTIDLYRIYFYGYGNGVKLYQAFYQEKPSVTLRMNRKQVHFAEMLMKYKSQETSALNLLKEEG